MYAPSTADANTDRIVPAWRRFHAKFHAIAIDITHVIAMVWVVDRFV